MRTSQVLEGVECSQSFEDKTNFPAFWKAPMDESRQIQLYLVSLGTVPVAVMYSALSSVYPFCCKNIEDGYTVFFFFFRHFQWPVW